MNTFSITAAARIGYLFYFPNMLQRFRYSGTFFVVGSYANLSRNYWGMRTLKSSALMRKFVVIPYFAAYTFESAPKLSIKYSLLMMTTICIIYQSVGSFGAKHQLLQDRTGFKKASRVFKIPFRRNFYVLLSQQSDSLRRMLQ